MEKDKAHPVVLYDGVCGLCSRLVQFILKRDSAGTFHFAALQSQFARDLLAKHGKSVDSLDTFYLVTGRDGAERIRERARAALQVLRILGGGWRLFTVFSALPTFLLDAMYNVVAKTRYRIFGKSEQCFLPVSQYKHRFLDGDESTNSRAVR